MGAGACKPVVSMRCLTFLAFLAVASSLVVLAESVNAMVEPSKSGQLGRVAYQSSGDDGDEQPTRTPRSRNRTPTPIGNELRGLPTPMIDADGDGEPDSPTPTPTVNRTPTVRPSATIAPTTSESGMVAALVGPEGGSLSSPAGASIEMPEGALPDVSTVSIQPVSDSKLPTQAQVDLVPSSAFDISIAGPDGRAIESLSQPAEFRIELDDEEMRDGVRLYRVEGAELVPLANTRIDGNELVIAVTSASRIVAGVPSPSSSGTSRRLLPFLLAAVVVVLVLIGMVVLGGMFRPRRQRVVVTRRPPRQRSRYR